MRYTLLTPTVHQAFSAQNISQRNDQKEIWAAQLYINIMHGPWFTSLYQIMLIIYLSFPSLRDSLSLYQQLDALHEL